MSRRSIVGVSTVCHILLRHISNWDKQKTSVHYPLNIVFFFSCLLNRILDIAFLKDTYDFQLPHSITPSVGGSTFISM